MIFIAERSINSSLKNMGFASYDAGVGAEMNRSLQAFVKNQSQKLSKQLQRGGAETTLPLEYFGVKTNHYFEDAPRGVDMTVSDSTIRPAFSIVDPNNTIKDGGAAASFSIPAVSIKRATANMGVSPKMQQIMKSKFENTMQQVLRKAGKKSNNKHLYLQDLKDILSQRQYQTLFKH